MVGPTVASQRNSKERLLLVATQATIDSKIYQSAFSMVGKETQTLALPELAGAIESGASQEVIASMLEAAFSSIDLEEIDSVLLACTHYPLVAEQFRRVVPERISLIDPADAVAERVLRDWWPREVRSGKLRFLVSKDSGVFRDRVASFFPESAYSIEVVEPAV